jgi:transposase-like protein
MGEHRRKADGRRVFSTDFKRATVQRVGAGEKTVAELSRELDIAPSVIRSWKRFAEAGAATATSGPTGPFSTRRTSGATSRTPSSWPP